VWGNRYTEGGFVVVMDKGNRCGVEWLGMGWVVDSGKCRGYEVVVEVGNIGAEMLVKSRRMVEGGGNVE
jgi:hypothetical protein